LVSAADAVQMNCAIGMIAVSDFEKSS